MRMNVNNIKLRKFTLLLTCFYCLSSFYFPGANGPGLTTGRQDSLSYYFKNPPPAYSIIPFWSLNNTLDSNRMKWQVDQMLDKGVYGAFMHARDGLDQSATPYFSDGWWNAIESVVRYAHEKGFYPYIYDEDKWPSGSAGGRTIAQNPARNVKKIMWYTKFEVLGEQSLQIHTPKTALAAYAGRISDQGQYDFSSQLDITASVGKTWEVPKGRWEIMYWMPANDADQQINYLDSATVADFFHVTHDVYYQKLGKYFGNTIPGAFFDEIFANAHERKNNIFWSDDFREQFKKLKGYDPLPYLPLLILNDPKVSPAKRYDYFDVVRQLYAKAWFKQYADWAAQHHIWVTGHTSEELIQYIRQADYFFTEGQLQVPCTDNEDFRYGFPRQIDFYNPKQISSIGHMYGRSRMSAESMGGGGYTIPLDDYRYGFSMLGVYGVNMFIPHLFHYSMERPENQADWPPSWFYQNPYWKYFKNLAVFAQRLSYMLSQGRHECRVAIAYPLTQIWMGGYTTPVSDEFYREVQRLLLEQHIDYDVVDPYSLAHAAVSIKGLKIGEETYSTLVLPEITALTGACLQKVSSFVHNGGTLIGLKDIPQASEKIAPEDPTLIKTVTELFGFEPNDLRQNQYHSTDTHQTERWTSKQFPGGGKVLFSRFVETLPDMLRRTGQSDITVTGEGNDWLRYQHRVLPGRDMYYFVNSRKDPGHFRVQLQQQGEPEIWDPETGSINRFTATRLYQGKREIDLHMQPWQSLFIIIPAGGSNDGNNDLLLTDTDWKDALLYKKDNTLVLDGWARLSGNSRLVYEEGGRQRRVQWNGDKADAAIPLNGNWTFQLSPHAVQYDWRSSVTSDTVDIPVMQYKGEGNSVWRTIKVVDPLNSAKGAERYATNWDAAWICYYDTSMHIPDMGAASVQYRKDFFMKDAAGAARLFITADKNYTLWVNGKEVGKGGKWQQVDEYDLRPYIIRGNNQLLIRSSPGKALLAQAEIESSDGTKQFLATNAGWQASKDGVNWLPALSICYPPLGEWGNLPFPGKKITYPLTVTYRQYLPPGTHAIRKPDIKGSYKLLLDGKPLQSGQDFIHWIMTGSGLHQLLEIKVTLQSSSDGLRAPVQAICGNTSLPLKPWQQFDLPWYSGKALYTKEVVIPATYLAPDKRLMLDLGRIMHFAEVWVNDNLVITRTWAPYQADITKFVREGKNTITIVVANLLANEATWNTLDANINEKTVRWWNEGTIRREQSQLASGMLGPVVIVPYKHLVKKLQ